MNIMFSSQSFTKHINLETTTRLPISPPPEEEIRSKDVAMRGSPFKQSQAHFSVGCQPSSSMFIELSDHNPGMNQLTFGENVQNTSASVSRKRGRAHVFPLADSSNVPSNGTSADPSPNPKSRKQVKIHSSASFKGDANSSRKMRRSSVTGHDRSNMGSPRGKRTNTGAQDYVPGGKHAEHSDAICPQKKGKSKSRRSLTPSVPYEPPVEQFTPPRSVVRSGIVSPAPFMTRRDKPMSSGFRRKQSLEPKVVKVKVERLTSPFPLPPLDLSRPVPPPSPTDDPLLLMDEHATSPSDISMNDPVKENFFPDRSSVSHASPSQSETSPSTPFVIADSPSSNGISEALNVPRSNNSSLEIFGGAAHPRFSLPYNSPGTTEFDVFSSDNEETKDELGEAEGEFTGRFKFYKTPIKDDPPSSATKMRRESWGRPISPFPRKLLFSLPSDEEHEGENDLSHQEESPPSPSDGRGKHVPSHPDSLLRRYVSDKGDVDSGHFVGALEMQQSGASDLDRSLAITFSNESPSRSCGSRIIEGDFDGSSSDGELDSRIVEVSSSDPRAAARAAAILKLHHSYVVGDVNVKTGALPSTHIMHQKCIPLDSVKADDRGSPEGLVQHLGISENPVSCYGVVEQTHGDFATQEEESKIPLRCMSVPASETSYSQLSQGTVTGWTKSHWKKLDTCFTDERYAVAAAMGLPGRIADVSDVQVEAVAARFINEMGEDGGWDRVTLIRRVTALVARQCSGKGAPPSSSLLTVNSHSSQTKISRQSGRTQLELNPHSHIPLSLRAPRYAHLLEEAVSSLPVSDTPPVMHSTQSNLQVIEDNARLQTDSGSPMMSHMSTKPALGDQPFSNSTSTTKRALNYLGSLLGHSNGSNIAKRTISYSPVPALPIPHVNQIPRAPVTTPAKRSIPKIQPPKELVRLTERKPMDKEQVPPKSKCAKDLVKLKHVEPLTSAQRPRFEPITIPLRGKRSVKDLVRGFEVMEQTNSHSVHTRDIRKVSSMGNLNTKPVWRP